MSSLRWQNFNYKWPTMLNFLCYNTDKPYLLSKSQMVTRLYKNYLFVKYHDTFIEDIDRGFYHFNHSLMDDKQNFKKMLELQRDSDQFQTLIKQYEQWMEENYDPTQSAYPNQPYSSEDGRIFLYPDEVLDYDPFGYYKPRTISYEQKDHATFFYEDYPYEDNYFVIEDLDVQTIPLDIPQENLKEEK